MMGKGPTVRWFSERYGHKRCSAAMICHDCRFRHVSLVISPMSPLAVPPRSEKRFPCFVSASRWPQWGTTSVRIPCNSLDEDGLIPQKGKNYGSWCFDLRPIDMCSIIMVVVSSGYWNCHNFQDVTTYSQSTNQLLEDQTEYPLVI